MASAGRRRPPRSSPEERAAKIDALIERLNGAVAELTEGDQWTAMLRAATRFHRYSFRNMMLLWTQAEQRDMPLTAVAGFTTWKSLGRTVRKGEHGLQILAPVTRRRDDPDGPADGEGGSRRVMTGVRIAHVFDISQTDGAPLPEPPPLVPLAGKDTAQLWEPLAALVRAEGFQLQRNPETGAVQGWTRYGDRVVSVRPDIDDAHAVAVLAHELGHIRADHEHRDLPRAQAETEAESIAHVVLAANGVDSTTSAVPYLAGWSGGDPAVIAAAAETVHTAAAGILTDLATDEPAGPLGLDTAPTRALDQPARRSTSRSAAGPAPSR